MVQRVHKKQTKKKNLTLTIILKRVLRADFNSGLTNRLKTTDCKTERIFRLKVYNGALILRDSISHSVGADPVQGQSESKAYALRNRGSSKVLSRRTGWRESTAGETFRIKD